VICVEKVASVIEKLLEDEGEQHNKIHSEEIKRKQRPSFISDSIALHLIVNPDSVT
jgi:hypothetical protein